MSDVAVSPLFPLVGGPLCGSQTASCPPKGRRRLTLVMEWKDCHGRLWVCFYRFVGEKLRYEFVKMERWNRGTRKYRLGTTPVGEDKKNDPEGQG
jgi:hypothetical protein